MGFTDKLKDKFAKDSPEDKTEQRLEHEAHNESNMGSRISNPQHVPTTGTHYVPGTTVTSDNAMNSGLHNNPSSPNRVPVPGSNTYSQGPGVSTHVPGVSTTTNTNTHTTISGGHRQSPTMPGSFPQNTNAPHQNTTGTHIPGTNTTVPGTASHHHNTTGSHVPGTALGAGAVGAGTAGYAAHEHGNHHHSPLTEKTHANRPIDPYTSSGQNTAASVIGDHDGVNRNRTGGITNQSTDFKTGPHQHLENPAAIPVAGGERVGSNVDEDAPLGSTHQHGQHHYGRDAGMVGAGGLGAHELNKNHHRDSRDNYNDQYEKPSTGEKIKSAILPGHNSNERRSSPPNTPPRPGHNTYSPTHNTHTVTGDKLRSDVPHDSQHHYGRDAAVVGGTGALGAGAYEANKHHGRNSPGRHSPTGQHHGQTGYNDYNEKPSMGDKIKAALPGNNNKNTTSSNYPNQHHDSSLTSGSPTTQHHYGRDAAAVGGVGALGAGAYEAEKHHHGRHSPTTGHHPNEFGERSAYQSNPTGASHAYTSGPVNTTTHHDHARNTSDHHYGRDAALAGGAGTAGVGAYELGKDHRRHSPTGNRRHSNEYDDDYNNKPSTGEKIKSALIPGRNKDSKDSDYNTTGSNLDHTNTHNTHDQHHYGRDAALGAGALGAGGAAAHHHNNDKHGLGHSKQDSGIGNTGIPARMPTHKEAAAAVPSMPTDWTMAKKLGGAYEAGYRDAMEHMREEMKKHRV